MGLDITFTRRKKIVCPKCGELIGSTVVDAVYGSGRGWYPLLESIGYYVPYEQRTEENDWYGKDMVLTKEQQNEAFIFVASHSDLYGAQGVKVLLATASTEQEDVVVYADW